MAESTSYVDAFHVIHGLIRMYAVDANTAVSQHPLEWKRTPWTAEEADAARTELNEKAKATGQPLLPEPDPLTPEEQAAVDEHAAAVAEANERLTAFREKKAAEKAEADQIAADEALVASPPPRPDPTVRRPFGRKGEPTPAELALIEKQNAKKAEDEKLAQDKANVDKFSGAKVADKT